MPKDHKTSKKRGKAVKKHLKGVSKKKLRKALADVIRSLTSNGSPADQAVDAYHDLANHALLPARD
jgi:hypothetical protein